MRKIDEHNYNWDLVVRQVHAGCVAKIAFEEDKAGSYAHNKYGKVISFKAAVKMGIQGEDTCVVSESGAFAIQAGVAILPVDIKTGDVNEMYAQVTTDDNIHRSRAYLQSIGCAVKPAEEYAADFKKFHRSLLKAKKKRKVDDEAGPSSSDPLAGLPEYYAAHELME